MLNIILCGNDPFFLNVLYTLVKGTLTDYEISCQISSVNLGSIWTIPSCEEDPDLKNLFFLDMAHLEMSSYDLLKLLGGYSHGMNIVFICPSEKLIPRNSLHSTFRLMTMENMKNDIPNVLCQYFTPKALVVQQNDQRRTISLKTPDGSYKLYMRDILYLETHSHNVQVHTVHGHLAEFRVL